MNLYYRVTVTMTAKPIGKASGAYTVFDHATYCYQTIEQAQKHLAQHYGTCKRVKMYVGEGKHVGYIYCFKNSDVSHNSTPWFQQDWVEVAKVHEETTIQPFVSAYGR